MELYSLMMKAVLCLNPTPCNVFVYPKRIWPEVLYAFSFRFFVPAPSVQTINFTFSWAAMLVEDWRLAKRLGC